MDKCPRCPQQLAIATSLPPSYFGGAYQCNKCNQNKNVSMGSVKHCYGCNFDLCPQCQFQPQGAGFGGAFPMQPPMQQAPPMQPQGAGFGGAFPMQQGFAPPPTHQGKTHPDTQVFDDSVMLKLGQSFNHKVARINVFHDASAIYGLEIFYKSQTHPGEMSSGKHCGKEFGWTCTESQFALAEDEYIVEMYGKMENYYYGLGFATNKGRRQQWGGQKGNSFAHQCMPGQHWATFSVGIGGHLHNITMMPLPIPAGGAGFGGAFPMQQPMQQAPPPQPSGGILGGLGNVMTQLGNALATVTVTSNTNTSAGGMGGMGGGMGGMGGSPFENQKLKSIMMKKSNSVGRALQGQYFDDLQEHLKNNFFDCELQTITVHYDQSEIRGIECTYKDLSNNFGPFRHMQYGGFGVMQASITLDFGEHFKEISGRAGERIDHLTIKTDRGKSIDVGGFGGAPFQNLLKGAFPKVHGLGGMVNQIGLGYLYVIHN